MPKQKPKKNIKVVNIVVSSSLKHDIPLEKMAPKAIPRLATIMMVLKEMALEPRAEFKKLTASLLTPTTRSAAARPTSAMIINK